MARRGALTALQAVLAGISGGAGGYIQQEEMKRKRMTDEQERERRKALDIADLQERNYTSPEQLAKSREAAAPATSRVARSAILSALSPMAPAPMPSTADIATVMETASLRQPLSSEQRLSMYGQEFVRPESSLATTQREKAMDRANRMFESAAERRTRQEEMTYQRGRDKAADELAGKQYGLDVRRVGLAEQAAKQRESDASWRRDKLPAAAAGKLAGFESGLSMAADVRNQIEGNKQALGLKNLAWGQLVNRLDPDGVGVRAGIEALSGEIRNQRFGGALTVNEAKFAERFLPSATDRADAALNKLTQLEKYLELKRKGIYDVYGGKFQPSRVGSALDELDALAGGGF
jgi:hypothetical protein